MKQAKCIILIVIFFGSMTARGQWNQSSFVPSTLFEVDFPAANAAYLAGYQFLYKSTDGGVSWNQIYDSGPFANFSDLKFVNADTGFVNLYGNILRTFDGGTTWTAITGNGSQPIKITGEKLFASYAINDTTYVVRSDDYGANWTTLFQHYEVNALPYLFSFVDALNAYFINPNQLGQVYKTTDGCLSFDTLVITNGSIVPQAKYDFKDLQHGYLYGSWGSLSHPTRTWNTGTFYFPIDLDGFGVLPVLDLDFNTSKLYASTLYGKIYYSQDNGQNWVEQSTPVNDPIVSISFLNNNQGIAVNGQAIFYTNNGGFTGIHENTGTSLINVFPNPAARTLNIQNNSTQLFQFTLYNSLGEIIIEKNLTSKLSTIGLSAYSKGIYYYKLISDSNKLTSGKIIKE